MKTFQRMALAGVLATLAACNADQTTGSGSDTPYLDSDLARIAADATAEDVELMGGPAGLLGFGLSAPPATPGPGWHCEGKTRDGRTVTRSCVFKDADGVVQEEYDPATTATIDIDVHVSGTVSRDHWDATVDRERHLVVSGLAGTETTRTWNGTGSGTVSRSRHTDGAEARTYDITYTTTITNVVVPVPRTDHGWPISGTISRHAVVHITGGPRDGQTVERDITVTFNGTEHVSIAIDGQTFDLDLATREIQR